MAFHVEVMQAEQESVMRRLGAFASDQGYYLAGGTAVALHLGHRRSLDLDWFVQGGLPDPLRMATDLQQAGIPFEVTEIAPGTLHGMSGAVRLSFFEYRYPALAAGHAWPEYGCRLAALEDLACMKLAAVGGRGARKDFVDLYGLGRVRFTLGEMLELYRAKFGTADVGHAVMSLAYFDDAEQQEMPEMLWDVSWKEIRQTLEDWVRAYVGG